MPLPSPATDPDDALLEALVRAAFGGGARVRERAVLTGGTYNSVHRVVLADGRGSVLKLAPPSDRPRLTYEHGITATEALVHERTRPVCGPLVPEVLHLGAVPGDPGRAYLFLGHLPGVPWTGSAGSWGGPWRRCTPPPATGSATRGGTG
ncbi:phosphotransferase family protein [Nocardiopsis sp. HUAS JQ3]|uniref:phosphotransferase family protein n=1 Tax=Nocardiopsis sp. HUAS JQ3 TaxID=3061629 RepID=UPI0023A9A6AE|nr:hypothetical protein [Nocardiopsis sp. HUAS JQ3]WDZ88588.1 hypothetical protein PV789_16585 [Nocardiopsis sp. HUAS JQ3]